MSCATANTGNRDLSGINIDDLYDYDPCEEYVLFNPSKQVKSIEVASFGDPVPFYLADDYEDCMLACECNGGSTRGCHELCE